MLQWALRVGGRWAPRCLPMCLVTLASLSNRWLGMLWPHSRVVGRGLAGFFFRLIEGLLVGGYRVSS